MNDAVEFEPMTHAKRLHPIESALAAGAAELGIGLTPEQVEQFRVFQAELIDWNQRMNLTSIVEPREIEIRHFLDSLTVLAGLYDSPALGQAARLIDVGSGAGLPGIPLAIVVPTLRVTLLEATQKKCRFLDHIVDTLDLPNAEVRCGRAEELAHLPDLRAAFNVAVVRAVGGLAALVEMCLPFLRVGGRMIAQKKLGVENEVVAATRAVATLGGRLAPPIVVRVPFLDERRQLIVVEKVRPSPSAYPRRPGRPATSPL